MPARAAVVDQPQVAPLAADPGGVGTPPPSVRLGSLPGSGPGTPTPSAEAEGAPTEGTTDLSFVDPRIAGEVHDVFVEDDGQILVGGRIDRVDGDPRGHLARLNADGTLDVAFDPGLTGWWVNALAQDATGRILVGGSFSVDGGVSYRSVIRLQPDGTVDPTFANPAVAGAVNAIAVQLDGRILIAGSFTTVQGTAQRGVARLNSDGSLDPTFANPSVTDQGGSNAAVHAMALNSDGSVLIGGNFRKVAGVGRNMVARLLADGSLDTSYSPQMTGTEVLAVAAAPDGSALVGGTISAVGGTARRGLARLDPNGSLDATFDAAISPAFDVDLVHAITVQPDGQILIGGTFAEVGGEARAGLARLDPSGKLDSTLADPLIVGDVLSIALPPDGEILVGGDIESAEGHPYDSVARILSTSTSRSGDLDHTFGRNGSWWLTPVASISNDVAIEADGSVVTAGSAAGMGGRILVTRTDAAGRPDCCIGSVEEGVLRLNLTSGDDWAEAVAIQPDGKIVLAGHIGGSSDSMVVVRLKPDGARDTTFSGDGVATIDFGRGLDVAVDLALRPDGRMVVAGIAGGGNSRRIGVARLTANGSPDLTFSGDGKVATDLGGNGEFGFGVAVQPDGRVVVAGVKSPQDAVVLRYKANGRLDPTFSGDGIKPIAFTAHGSAATGIAVADDGDIVVSGTDLSGGGRFAVARLDGTGRFDRTFASDGTLVVDAGPGWDEAWDVELQPDGRIVLGGDTGSGNSFAVIRVLADGTLDPAFSGDGRASYNLVTGGELAIGLALQPDGRAVLAGLQYASTPHTLVARVWP